MTLKQLASLADHSMCTKTIHSLTLWAKLFLISLWRSLFVKPTTGTGHRILVFYKSIWIFSACVKAIFIQGSPTSKFIWSASFYSFNFKVCSNPNRSHLLFELEHTSINWKILLLCALSYNLSLRYYWAELLALESTQQVILRGGICRRLQPPSHLSSKPEPWSVKPSQLHDNVRS